MSSKGSMYSHHFNSDLDPFFVNMQSGIASWLLPKGLNIRTSVRLITHLADDNEDGDDDEEEGGQYFEDVLKKKTFWEFPDDLLSQKALTTVEKLRSSTRAECESYLKARFDPKASADIQETIETVFEVSESSRSDAESDNSSQSSHQRPTRPTSKSSTSAFSDEESPGDSTMDESGDSDSDASETHRNSIRLSKTINAIESENLMVL